MAVDSEPPVALLILFQPGSCSTHPQPISGFSFALCASPCQVRQVSPALQPYGLFFR